MAYVSLAVNLIVVVVVMAVSGYLLVAFYDSMDAANGSAPLSADLQGLFTSVGNAFKTISSFVNIVVLIVVVALIIAALFSVFQTVGGAGGLGPQGPRM